MSLELDGLTHRYGEESAVSDVSFEVGDGELVALLGPSGCGKTTIVQAIAGHVSPTAGRIGLHGATVTGAPPEARNVGIVFQRSTLYPHMTVGENVAYGLIANGVAPSERDERVSRLLELVDLAGRREAHPAELSGGQQRRVELARALAPRPDILLLDEPLSGLDPGLRERLREEIARIQEETGVTTLFVTHDQEEAMAVADRLVVMNDGSIAGIGPPRELYESPPTPFVASFLGRSNALSARVVETDPPIVDVGGTEVRLNSAGSIPPTTSEVTCHVRPAALSITTAARDDEGVSSPAAEGDGALSGTVTDVRDVGCRYDVTVRLPTDEELVVERRARPPESGATVTVTLDRDSLTVFTGDGD